MNNILISRNPLDEQEVGSVKVASNDDVVTAVNDAKQAQIAWGKLTSEQRAQLIIEAFSRLNRVQEQLVNLISKEMGKDHRRATYEVMGVIQSASYLCREIMQAIAPVKKPSGTKIYYRPLGVVGVISPWNYPLAMANNLLLPALVAGNTVVLKPSEITPLVADMFVRTLNEVLPNGVLSVIHGDGEVGKALVASNINMVAFTGSAAAGKHIMASSANKLHRLVMELGGNDPMIVLADADINKAARFAVASSFENAGQMCTSTERIYVDERIHNTFVERVVEIAKQYTVGPWDQPRVNIGPIVNKKQHQQIIHHLKDAKEKGARFLLGSDDYLPPYIQPTVIDGLTDEMLMAKEETFGPVVAIDSFSNIDEAIMRANNVPLGLGAVVFGECNAAYVAENMEAGMVGINGGPGAGDGPWVGAKESGFGYHGSLEGHRQFTQVQVINA